MASKARGIHKPSGSAAEIGASAYLYLPKSQRFCSVLRRRSRPCSTYSLVILTAQHLFGCSDHMTRYMLTWEPRQRTYCWMQNDSSDGGFTIASNVRFVSTMDLFELALFQCVIVRTAITVSSCTLSGDFASSPSPLALAISSWNNFLRQEGVLDSRVTLPCGSVRSQIVSSRPSCRSQIKVEGKFSRRDRPLTEIGCRYL